MTFIFNETPGCAHKSFGSAYVTRASCLLTINTKLSFFAPRDYNVIAVACNGLSPRQLASKIAGIIVTVICGGQLE